MQKLEEAHAKIDQDAEAGRGKLGHDGDNIDPAKLRAYEQETWTKHLALENSFLAERRAEWTAFRAARQKALAAIDADLQAAKYGADANSYLLSILSQYQLLGIEELQDLLQTAQQDVLHAAEWQQRWKDWQEQNK
jgi:hypothetical protein